MNNGTLVIRFMMITMRVLIFCILSIVLKSVSAQQTYQKQGDNYHAAVTIQRDSQMQNPYPNAPRQPYQSQQNVKPWRQGDRLTKQELIQNIAKALLTRKKTPSERKEEERQRNELKMQEYIMMKAGLAGKAQDQAPNTAAIYQPPSAPQGQVRVGAVPEQNPNAYNAASSQQFGQAPVNVESQNVRNYQDPGGNNRFASQTGNTFRGNHPGSMNNIPRHSQGQRQFNAGPNQRASQPRPRVYMPRRKYMN